MKPFMTLLASIMYLSIAAGPCLAQDHFEEFCNQYADLAVEQHATAGSGACGPAPMDPVLWHGVRDQYLAACRQGDPLETMLDMRQRHDHLLALCPDQAARMRCAVYTLETMAYVQAERDMGCAFDETQPRWTPGFWPHFNWCDGSQPMQGDLDARTQTRNELFSQCAAGAPITSGEEPPWADPGADAEDSTDAGQTGDATMDNGQPLDPTCEAYAQGAVDQNEQNQAQGCGFTGMTWSSSFDLHYAWCRNIAPAERPEMLYKESLARRELLESCGGEPVSP